MADRIVPRRTFLQSAAAACLGAALRGQEVRPTRARADWWIKSTRGQTPNIVFIYADDLGYGDLGCYGSDIPTPNLDHMASEGALFRQFYSASPVCSPSRAALLTGRYPTRVGIPRVLFPSDQIGIPDSETTIAQMLKTREYRTMCIGKWHVGSQRQFLPTSRGFDEYFGIPNSNDMAPMPLLHNTDMLEQPARLDTLTQRYTDQAVNFITRSKDSPFFLYLAHTYPHIPLAASRRFRGMSGLGVYGDAVMEMDWSVGQVLEAIDSNGLSEYTLVMFSSDNGPWYLGSPGRLRGRKGETYEGGVREPFLARWTGRIPPGLVSESVATTMDILPTVAGLCGAALPGRQLDGVDIWPLLTGEKQEVEREVLLYFDNWNVQCARMGKWKLHLSRYNSAAWGPDPPGGRINLPLPRPELYNVDADPQESYDVADDHPEVVTEIRARVEALIPSFPDQVRAAWQETMRMLVEPTPDGALPVRRGP